MLSMRITQAPVVVDVPETSVNTVDGGKCDKRGLRGGSLVYTIDAQRGVEHDGRHVFAAVEQMRELVACVAVSPYTL